jgi:hypothetical protein
MFGYTAGPIHCDVNNPNSRHAGDCHRFYHCKDTPEGPELIEKTCGPYMMYNHEKQVCDWPATVIGLRPECAGIVQVFNLQYYIDYQLTFLVYFSSESKRVGL